MNIFYLFKYLWQRRWLIVIPTIAAIFLTWLFSRHQASEYTSTAELSTGYMEVNPLADNSRAPNNTVLFNNVIQTLQSSQVLDLVSFGLILHDLENNSPFSKVNIRDISDIIKRYPGGKNAFVSSLSNRIDSLYVLDLARTDDRIIREVADRYGYSPDDLLGNVQITRVENSDFLMITTTTSNPGLSAFISNDICRKFLAIYQNNMGRASSTSLDTLRSLMQAKKQILDNKLQLLQDGGNSDISGSMGILSTLQAQVTQQKSNLIAAQVSLDNVIQQINAASKQGGLANNEEIITLRTNIDNLYERYVNGGSTDVNLLQQIDRLRSALQQKLSSTGVSAGSVPIGDLIKQKMDLDVKINVAKQTMKDLQDKINVLQSAVQSSAAKQGVEQGIQSEIAIARQQYEDANALYDAALNHNMFPGNDFRQVLQASPPLHPDPSNNLKIIGFAGTGVFFFVIFLLLLFEFIDPSIKNPSYLKARLKVPLLANLKYVDLKKFSVEQIFKDQEFSSKLGHGFLDQVKQLRYEVEHSGKKIFLVMGYHEGSGRTTIIESIANSLTLSNHSVLLVDANFKNNSLTQKYKAGSSLETFQAEGDSKAGATSISTIVSPSKLDRISIVGCGRGNYTPREVLPDQNLFVALRANKDYDYVLVDCASLSQGPDCKELLIYVDAVILVFAADQSFIGEDKKLSDFLDANGIQTLGAVLNRVPDYSMEL